MDEPHPLDDPAARRRVVRALLTLSPFMFAFTWWLAWIQGAAPRDCLLIAAIGLAMCLGAALVIHLMGSKSATALMIAKLVLGLAKRR